MSPLAHLALVRETGCRAADDGSLLCLHAGTARSGSDYVVSGGRVVTMVGRGDDLAAAREASYRGVAGVELDGQQHRTDIAAREVEA